MRRIHRVAEVDAFTAQHLTHVGQLGFEEGRQKLSHMDADLHLADRHRAGDASKEHSRFV